MINCILIDKDVAVFNSIKGYVQNLPDFRVVGYFEKPIHAVSAIIDQKSFNLILIDFESLEFPGFDLRELLHENANVVFMAKAKEYAVEAFEWQAIDFITKPITIERFLRCIIKARKQLLHANPNDLNTGYFYFKCGTKGGLMKLFFHEIIYIEAALNYVIIYTSVTNRHITYLTLKDMERELPSRIFFRVNKSFMINISKIKGVSNNSISLEEGISIHLGNSYRERFLKMLDEHTIRSRNH